MVHSNKIQMRNTLFLVLAAFIWGTAFVAQSVGADYVGAYTFLAARSWLACVFLGGLLLVRRAAGDEQINPFWKNGRQLIKGGLCCGAVLFFASAVQQLGIGNTESTAKAGFLTALYVVFVPVSRIFVGKRPSLRIWVCVAVSLAGLYMLCLAGRDTLSLTGGEMQLLLCAVLFTAQILTVNHFSPELDGVQLSFVQFLTVAVLSTVMMFVFESPTLPALAAAGISIAYCGILSSGVAYTLQIVGQQNLDPTIASLAMCLESVFSALGGWVVLGQVLSVNELIGCALMFAAIVAASVL